MMLAQAAAFALGGKLVDVGSSCSICAWW